MGGPARLRAVVAVLAASTLAGACGSTAISPTARGSVGSVHYENNGIAIDYPSDWHVIAHDVQENLMEYVIAVIGTGAWHENCSGTSCAPDTFDLGGGRVAVKFYLTHQIGPITICGGNDANATLGDVAVMQSGTATDRTWEIRRPTTPFNAVNNLWVEARSDDPAQVERAGQVLSSLRTADTGLTGPDCWSPEPATPS